MLRQWECYAIGVAKANIVDDFFHNASVRKCLMDVLSPNEKKTTRID
jgi:hypothetical protein